MVAIYDALQARRRPHFDEWAGPVIRIPATTYLKRADELREQHWLCKIVEALPRESVLVICGLIHVATVAEKLSFWGFIVRKASLCDHSWYRELYGDTCEQVKKQIVQGDS